MVQGKFPRISLSGRQRLKSKIAAQKWPDRS